MKTNNYVTSRFIAVFFLACLMIVALSATLNQTQAQTVLLSPTGDGGFENATSSFAANNWLTALPAVARQWQVGTVASSVAGGTKAAYVGAAANYNGANLAQVGHFYRDFSIPAGATNVLLSFYVRVPAPDPTFDYFRIFTTTNANTPVSGTNPAAGYTMIYENTSTAYAAFTAIPAIDLTALAGTTLRLVFTNVSDGAAPAATFAVDNISLVYTPPPVCSGTPNGGTTLSSTNPVCSGANFNLSLSGASSGTGLAFQWQSSPNNSTWTNIGGATLAAYTASQTSATYYRCQLTCSANPLGFSTSLLVNMNALANCYCIPVYTGSCAADRITNFLLNTLSNNSGATCNASPAGYSIYGTTPSNQTTTLDQGGSYTATISTVAGNTNGTGVAIWIDYNDNGTFDVSERSDNGASKFTSNTTGTLIVNVPVAAPLGPHSMRVMSARNVNSNALTPCAPGNANGETEDYIVSIAVATACSGNPTAGSTQSSANPVCYGATFTLSLSGATSLAGLTYQWQSSPDNITFTSIGGATGASYIANQTVPTYYQCIVTCSNSGQSATSTSLLVTVNPLENCYCVGTYDNTCSIDYISNVSFGGINNTTTCSGSLPNNRTVYSSPNPTFYRGFSYPLSVTTDGDVEGMRAWIDYDHSFSFIAGESVLAAAPGGPPQTTSATITIPLTAQVGPTLMRVRCRYSTAVGTGAACTNFTPFEFGETEDYYITIADAPVCSGTPVAGTTASTVSAACPSTSFTLSLTGNALANGLTYQWQSAPDVGGTAGTYSNIGGATASTYTTTLASTTWYRCVVTCSNGGASANSTPIKINTAVCINISNGSSTTCSANFYDSGGPAAGYIVNEDYVYTFFPNPGNQTQVSWSSFASEQDFDFITIYNGPNTSSPVLYGPASGTLAIPTFTSTDPSGAITIHFTSDFITNGAGWFASVTCVANPACTGVPAASTTIASANPACYNTPFNLTLSSNYLFNGISYQWQSAPDVSGSPGTFTNIAGATLSTYTATQTATKWYHCVISCSNSGQSTNSTNLRVTYQLCYCIPAYTVGCAADYISNFVLNTLSNNSGSTCSVSPAGYSVYAPTPINQTTILSPGTTYTATITVVTGNPNGTGVAIWID
ncbi:MAG: GEVED domain-containing protein, partial [Bacteroidota bacterium]